MKKITYRTISLFIALGMLFVLAIPASAQLGDKDESIFYVQNVSGNDGVSVTVKFVAEDGSSPTITDLGNGINNSFTLAKDEMVTINVPDVKDLPTGRYAVVISSTDKVVAVAEVIGTGSKRFTGSYTGFTSGTNKSIIPTINYNWYGWWGMISVMNLGSQPADVDVVLKCSNSSETGTLAKKDVPSMASVTFVLKDTVPNGFSSTTSCVASAEISADQPIVSVNNQNMAYTTGFTNTFEGYPEGTTTVYAPQLQKNFYGWVSSLNIAKVEPGSTTATVVYDDGTPNDTCNLTDASPQCQLFMGSVHPKDGRFAAKITASKKILIAVGSSHSERYSGGYAGFTEGSSKAAIPIFFKKYFNWNTAINCQNMGTVDTKLKFDYEGGGSTVWPTGAALKPGESTQVFSDNETAVSNGYAGSVIITPSVAGGEFACMIGNSNDTDPGKGDWTFQYNAPGE
jgi:hypothetical protein